ncbi:MAG: hypothetical protein GY870_11915 [archaeon]|nr:hypothetical protein [archaeon]
MPLGAEKIAETTEKLTESVDRLTETFGNKMDSLISAMDRMTTALEPLNRLSPQGMVENAEQTVGKLIGSLLPGNKKKT